MGGGVQGGSGRFKGGRVQGLRGLRRWVCGGWGSGRFREVQGGGSGVEAVGLWRGGSGRVQGGGSGVERVEVAET